MMSRAAHGLLIAAAEERVRQLMAGEIEPTSDVQRAAKEAWPKSDDDWGTERQINAENAFFDLICKVTDWDTDVDKEWEPWRLKATSEELIEGALVYRDQI